jgi:hypothetical protein
MEANAKRPLDCPEADGAASVSSRGVSGFGSRRSIVIGALTEACGDEVVPDIRPAVPVHGSQIEIGELELVFLHDAFLPWMNLHLTRPYLNVQS